MFVTLDLINLRGFLVLNRLFTRTAAGNSARSSEAAGEAGNWGQHQFRAERPRLSLV